MRKTVAPWLVLVALASCGGGELTATGSGGSSSATAGAGGSGGAAFDGPVVAATFAASAKAPLAGTLTVTVDRASRLEIDVADDGTHALSLKTTASATAHAVPVLQLRPGRKYVLRVTAIDAEGKASEPLSVTYETPALPADFPPLRVKASDATRDGLTFFAVGRWGAGLPDDTWAYVVALDAAGEVVWYFQTNSNVNHLGLTAAGDVRFGAGDFSLLEFSILGAPLRGWLAAAKFPKSAKIPNGITAVAIDSMHHDAILLPNGHFLALSSEMRTITKEMCPATYDTDWNVVGDVVVEFDPAKAAVVSKTSMFDLIDPCRRADQAFRTNFWTSTYGGVTADWTHANAVFYDPARNAVLVSLRHQDWVVAYRYADDAGGKAGSLLFRLGPEGDFALDGNDAVWNYQQHAASVLPNGNVMMYDNGGTRPNTLVTSKVKYPWSRAVEMSLDMSGPKETWKATQVWEYGTKDVRLVDASIDPPSELRWFSLAIGSAYLTPTNTVLAVHGALTDPPTGLLFNGSVKKLARIYEVTHDDAQKVVLDVRVYDEAGEGSYGVYRAMRIPSLYPASSGVVATVTKR